MLKTVASACAFAVLALSGTAMAHTPDRRTEITFSQPVSLPGVTLPAGTYVFRVLDHQTSHHVVQVMDGESGRTYALLSTVPVERATPAPDPTVDFLETRAGSAPALRAWWYPGQSIGYQFIYPTQQTVALARGGDVQTDDRRGG